MEYLALDLGAGSGRAIVGTIENGCLRLEEIHRFQNPPIQLGDTLYWDFLALFDHLKQSVRKAVQKGYHLNGIAVDTWGVDFGLLDADGKLLSNPVCYRDARTQGMPEKAATVLSKEELYAITGIQQLEINTFYQLFSLNETNDSAFSIADKLLFIPDLVNYFLTGTVGNEYTIASTSQLLDAKKRIWSEEVVGRFHFPAHLFQGKMISPGSLLGTLKENIAEETGAGKVNVFAVGSHDTASAIAAIPAEGDNWAFLSSGTWSLLGVLNNEPVLTSEALQNDFTNEGGVGSQIRFLRNIPGLWLLQRLIAEWEKEELPCDYPHLLSECAKNQSFHSIVDSDDSAFTHPVSMRKAIQNYCQASGQAVPDTQGELVRCVLESLAWKYSQVMKRLEKVTGRKINQLHVVGGGSQNEILNQLIANSLNIEVVIGLTEATAVGNIIQQAIADRTISDWKEGHQIIKNSFTFKSYYPKLS